MKKFDNNLRGCEFENEILDALQLTLNNSNAKNTTIFCGFKINEKHSLTKKNEEYDFFIISAQEKMIIHIEAKCTNTEDGKNKEKAALQLLHGLAYFRSNYAFPIMETWTFAKMIAFKNDNHELVCPSCQLFVLDPNRRWIDGFWWTDIIDKIRNRKKTEIQMPDQRIGTRKI